MRLRASTFNSRHALVVLCGAVTLWLPARALGQACCAGATLIAPGRLTIHEDAVAGIQVKGTGMTGSFSPTGTYQPMPAGTSETDFEQDVLGTLRVLPRGQITLLVPVLETRRTTPTLSEVGGGLGDINLSARYDFLLAKESVHIPGIALLLGMTFPSGKPTDAYDATHPLGTDATGTGAFQATGGIGLEQVFGPVLVGVTGMLSYPFPRTIPGVGTEQLGLLLFGTAQVAYTFENEAGVALAMTYSGSGDASLDGQTVPQSGRATTLLSLAAALPVGEGWRLQGNISQGLPLQGLGQNQQIGFGFAFTVLKAWL